METATEMRQKAGSLHDEAKGLSSKDAPTAEDETRHGELITEADTLIRRACMLEGGEAMEQYLNAPLPRVTRNTSTATPDAPEWRDQSGNPIAVAERGVSYADEVRRVTGATRDRDQPRIGEVLRSIVTGQESRAGTAGLGTYAGYTTDSALSAEVIDLARNTARVAQAGARFLNMPAGEMTLVKATGDPTAAWYGEGEPIAESASTFGKLNFRARKLGCIMRINRELAQDAPNAVSILEQQLGAVIGLELDRVALLGDADGEEPTGLFNTDGVTEQGSVGSPTYDDWLDAVKAIEDANGVPNSTIYSPATKLTLSKLKDSQGSYLAPPAGFTELGRYTTKQLADTQAVVGAFDNLLIGTRSQVSIARSEEAGDTFERDQIAVRITWRGDVQVARGDHFTILTGIS